MSGAEFKIPATFECCSRTEPARLLTCQGMGRASSDGSSLYPSGTSSSVRNHPTTGSGRYVEIAAVL